MERAVDDERGQRRRQEVWTRIRDSLLTDDGKEERWTEAKSWVNLDIAKKALSEMTAYPNTRRYVSIGATSKHKVDKTKKEEKSTTADGRFVFSKEVDDMFHESTTGNDYEEKLAMEKSDDSSSDNDVDDESSDDNADPLKGFHADDPKSVDSSSSEDKPTACKVDNEDNISSSDSDSSDSESETALPNTVNKPSNDTDESEDDFFTTEKVSTAEVFAQAEKEQYILPDRKVGHSRKKSDKSKGFSTQNQTKREFRNFQHRKKRSRLG
jgi:hypothetical protein